METSRIFGNSVPISQQQQQSSTQSTLFSTSPIFISGQKTHSEETISKNGLSKEIHVVVKNSPFHVTIGGATHIDVRKIAFDAFLVYDETSKEVDFVKSKPVELKVTPTESGNEVECELRIKVLTSHHEDLLFKIKLSGYNPITKEEIPGLFLYTFPIKVISKPEQLKKRPPSKKRTLTDMLVETITRIEKKQEEQQTLIERVLNQQLMMPISYSSVPPQQSSFLSSEMESPSIKKRKHDLFWDAMTDPSDKLFDPIPSSSSSSSSSSYPKEKDGKKETVDFESAFSSMLKSYNLMTQEEKPETIRKMVRNTSSRETERLSELLDLFWTEGLLKERSYGSNTNTNPNSSIHIGNSGEGCTCAECPHKVELERIDDFYKEFLHTGVQLPPGF